MKKSIIILTAIFAFFAMSATSFAEVKEVKIKTSAVCAMCKTRIEKAVNQLDGIINVNLNVADAYATVKFDDKSTSVDKIKKSISLAGYQADDVKADAKAFKMLPDHCKGAKATDKCGTTCTHDTPKKEVKADAKACGTSCDTKSATEKAACCPKGCETKAEVKTDAKACCPSKADAKACCPSQNSVKIDGTTKLEAKCDPSSCKTACPSKTTTPQEPAKK